MTARRFAVCVGSGQDDLDLERWKIYEVVEDAAAESRGHYRVVDESGEDYLYPQEYFRLIELPSGLAELYSKANRARR
jgi:hypothetical protein